MLSSLKQASISLGIYKPARALHRAIHPTERSEFEANKKLLAQFVGPRDLAFDVGANIGNRSEAMLALGARVVAFEPQPLCAREIRARGNKRLTVVETAVGATKGSAKMHLKAAHVQASLVDGWQGGADVGILNVPVTTLDLEIAKHGAPVFCKIDVEGFEAEVLKGLSRPIKSLSLEYHTGEEGAIKIRECLGLLSALGSYEVNIIGGEEIDWLLPAWLPLDAFMRAFPACAKPHFWGDMFLRRV